MEEEQRSIVQTSAFAFLNLEVCQIFAKIPVVVTKQLNQVHWHPSFHHFWSRQHEPHKLAWLHMLASQDSFSLQPPWDVKILNFWNVSPYPFEPLDDISAIMPFIYHPCASAWLCDRQVPATGVPLDRLHLAWHMCQRWQQMDSDHWGPSATCEVTPTGHTAGWDTIQSCINGLLAKTQLGKPAQHSQRVHYRSICLSIYLPHLSYLCYSYLAYLSYLTMSILSALSIWCIYMYLFVISIGSILSILSILSGQAYPTYLSLRVLKRAWGLWVQMSEIKCTR